MPPPNAVLATLFAAVAFARPHAARPTFTPPRRTECRAHGAAPPACGRRAVTRAAPAVSAAPYDSGYVNTSLGSTTLSYTTPAYFSVDKPHSLALFYASGQAAPTALVQVDATDNTGDPPAKMSVKLRSVSTGAFETLTSGGTEVFYQAGSGTTRLAAQFSTASLSTGAYAYDVIVTSYWSDGTTLQAPAVRTRVLVVNERNSPYGAGWTIPGVQRLYVQSDGIFVTEGDGTGRWFRRSPQCTTPTQQWCYYTSPDGDFSRLTYDAHNNRYQRHYRDGTVVRFSASGVMQSVSPSNGVGGGDSQLTYDAAGRLSTLVDPAGKTITLGYSTAGKLATATDAAARVVYFTVGASGTLDAVCDAVSCPLHAGYDASYRMSWRTDRAGSQWDFGYDGFGSLATATAPSIAVYGVGSTRPVNRYRSLAAAVLPPAGTGGSLAPAPRVLPAAALVLSITPKSDTTRIALDRLGQPVATTDPLGRTVQIQRDTSGRPTRLIAANGDITDYTYAGPFPKEIRDVTNSRTTTFTYTSYYGYPEGSYPLGTYDGYPLKVTAPGEPAVTLDQAGTAVYTSQSGPLHTYWDEIDGFYRPVTVYRPSATVHYFYAQSGNRNTDSVQTATGTDTLTVSYARDAVGRVVRMTAPGGRTVRFAYDALNRVTFRATATDSVRFTYTTAGQLSTLVDGKGQATTFGYNALGWRTSIQDPRGGVRGSQYDAAGNLVAQTNRRAQTVVYAYDRIGRLAQRTSAEGEVTTYAYDPNGLWTAVTGPEGSDTVRVTRGASPSTVQAMVLGGHRYTITTVGDTLANTLTETGSWGWGVQYLTAADHSGELVQLRDLQTALNTGVTRDTTQNSTSTTLPDGHSIVRAPNQQSYDDAAVGGALDVYFLRQVADGRLAQFNYVDQKYDGSDELIEQGGIIDWSFQYKVIASFAWDSAANPKHASASVSTGNRLDSFNGFTLQYDADGNLVRRTKAGVTDQTLTWNSLGQLVRVTDTSGLDVTYGYDGRGRRVRKTKNGVVTRYLHDADQVVAELDAAGNVTRNYTWYPGVDRPHSLRTATDTYYYVTDPRGNVTGVVHPTQGMVNHYDYTAFGEASTATETVPNPIRFAGREYDAETGLYYFRARYYDPAIQRFASQDPAGIDAGTNPYAFAGNDPMNGADATGLCPIGSPFGNGWAQNSKGEWVPWDPCQGDDGGDRPHGGDLNYWSRWYYENQTGHDPATEQAYLDALAAEAEAQQWAAQRQASIEGAVHSHDYSQGLSDSEKIILGVKARLQPVEPYLEAAAVGAIAFPAVGVASGAYAFFAGGAEFTALSIEWGRLPAQVVETFRSGTYTARYLEAPQTLFRVFGGEAGAAGRFWTTLQPSGPLQATLDLALHPSFGNTAEFLATSEIPQGTLIFEGFAGPQGAMIGGGPQVFIPGFDPAWITGITAF